MKNALKSIGLGSFGLFLVLALAGCSSGGGSGDDKSSSDGSSSGGSTSTVKLDGTTWRGSDRDLNQVSVSFSGNTITFQENGYGSDPGSGSFSQNGSDVSFSVTYKGNNSVSSHPLTGSGKLKVSGSSMTAVLTVKDNQVGNVLYPANQTSTSITLSKQ